MRFLSMWIFLLNAEVCFRRKSSRIFLITTTSQMEKFDILHSPSLLSWGVINCTVMDGSFAHSVVAVRSGSNDELCDQGSGR